VCLPRRGLWEVRKRGWRAVCTGCLRPGVCNRRDPLRLGSAFILRQSGKQLSRDRKGVPELNSSFLSSHPGGAIVVCGEHSRIVTRGWARRHERPRPAAAPRCAFRSPSPPPRARWALRGTPSVECRHQLRAPVSSRCRRACRRWGATYRHYRSEPMRDGLDRVERVDQSRHRTMAVE
jgi:hypothetical protein